MSPREIHINSLKSSKKQALVPEDNAESAAVNPTPKHPHRDIVQGMEGLIDEFELIADGDMESIFSNFSDLARCYDALRPGVIDHGKMSKLITEVRQNLDDFGRELKALKDQVDKSG